MKKEDRPRFLLAMAKTEVTLPTINLTDNEKALRADVFWEELEIYDIDKVEKAFKRARRELIFFPKPSEIISFIIEDLEWEYTQRQSIEFKERFLIEDKSEERDGDLERAGDVARRALKEIYKKIETKEILELTEEHLRLREERKKFLKEQLKNLEDIKS
ncbi:MAG: hypothetical protein K6T73_01310 [Candidatus Bathyarchaeota archaeon]|nr:hypothetical protein [Candidatus Bathyarchaeota archaeon]